MLNWNKNSHINTHKYDIIMILRVDDNKMNYNDNIMVIDKFFEVKILLLDTKNVIIIGAK